MRVWDVRRAIGALRLLAGLSSVPPTVRGSRQMAGVVLYASLFEPYPECLELHELPSTHREGPELLKVRRGLDFSQLLAMAAHRTPVVLKETDPGVAGWATQLSGRLPSLKRDVKQ